MGVVSEAEFARWLSELDRGEFAQFVAALWDARGRETELEGEVVVVSDGEDTRRIAVVTSNRPGTPSREFDAVAASTDSRSVRSLAATREARLYGPSELRDLLLYATPRDRAEALVREQFGRELLRDASGEPSTTGPVDGAPLSRLGAVPFLRRALGDSPRRAVLLGAVLLLVAGAVAAGSTPVLGPDGERAEFDATVTFADDTESSTTATSEPPRAGTKSSSNESNESGRFYAYPPGLSPEGVTDASLLATTHAAVVRNGSYRLHLVYDGVWGRGGEGPRYSIAEEIIVVQNESIYRRHVSGRVQLAATETAPVNRSVYADGRYRYVRNATDGIAYRREPLRRGRTDEFATWSAWYITQFLSTSRSNVSVRGTGGNLTWKVVTTGTPTRFGGIFLEYRAEATVTELGFVRSLRVTFRPGGGMRPVRFAFTYSERASTNVSAPGWYDEARNATAAGESRIPPHGE